MKKKQAEKFIKELKRSIGVILNRQNLNAKEEQLARLAYMNLCELYNSCHQYLVEK